MSTPTFPRRPPLLAIARCAAALGLSSSGCVPNLTLSSEAQVSCASDAECPDGMTCSLELDLCVRTGADDTPPAIVSSAVDRAAATTGIEVRVTFEVSEALGLAPEVRLATPSADPFVQDDSDPPNYSLTFTPQGDEAEGFWPVLATLVDEAGLRTEDVALGGVRLDFTAPRAVGAAVFYTPDSSNPLDRVVAARAGTEVQILVSTDEPVRTTPGPLLHIDCDGDVVTLASDAAAGTGTFHVFETVWAGTLGFDGECPMSLDMQDLAGVAANGTPLPVALLVDDVAPEVSRVHPELLRHRRDPWGSSRQSDRPGQILAGAGVGPDGDPLTDLPAGAFDDSDEVIVEVRVLDPEGVHIGTSRRTAGGWEAVTLSARDSPRIGVVLIDEAGNTSIEVPVPQGAWVAGFGGKVAGSLAENPHRFTVRRSFTGALLPSPDDSEAAGEVAAADDASAIHTHGAGRWAQLSPLPAPAGEDGVAWATDMARGVVVAFGGGDVSGSTSRGTSDTWEWRLDAWRAITPSDPEGDGNPSYRRYAAMAYDPGRGVTVLFGGDSDYVLLGDTWEWNGASWQRRCDGVPESDTCSSVPTPRTEAAMAYAGPTSELLLFGGCIVSDSGFPCSQVTDELWAWDGDDWRPAPQSGTAGVERPPALHAASVAARGGEVHLFGGCTGAYCSEDALDDLWRYTPVSGAWTRVDPAGAPLWPAGRGGAALTFDPAGALYLFGGLGGFPCDSGGSSYCGDLYVWDSGVWQVAPQGPSELVPRGGNGLAWDVHAGRLLLFGGTDDNSIEHQTWGFDGSAWTSLGGGEAPPGRLGAAAAYHPPTQSVVVMGGDSFGGTLGDTWVFDGTWRSVASVAARSFLPMAYHPSSTSLVMYGGLFGGTQTWRWNAGWTAGPAGPSNRTNPGLALDAAGNLVMFGGQGGGDETWVYAGGAWEQRCEGNPVTDVCPDMPGPRGGGAMAYDQRNNRSVLFGGYDLGNALMGDTWLWDGAAWSEATVASAPPPRLSHGMIFDERRQQVILHGGELESSGTLADTWQWDGDAWTELLPSDPEGDANPSPHGRSSFVYDVRRNRGVLLGGSNDAFDQTWGWYGGADERPAHVILVDTGGGGLDAPDTASLEVRWRVGATGYDPATCDAIDGVSLSMWLDGAWAEVATSAASADEPIDLTWASDDEGPLVGVDAATLHRRAFFGRTGIVGLAAAPLAANGCGAAYAELVSDHVEVWLRYGDD